MQKSTLSAEFSSDVETVWSVVTDNSVSAWRSDLVKIEILDEERFVEFTRQGMATHFTITCKQPFDRYEFDLENENMAGHWSGIFTPLPDGGTRIEFTEAVVIKKWWMRMVSALFMVLKRIQKTYARDLRKALNELA